MSWIEFLGERWPTTKHDLELHLHLWPPLAHCPRQQWTLSLGHYEYIREEAPREIRRFLDFELKALHWHDADWRRLAGLEIRADAAWHAAREHFQEYGRLVQAQMDVGVTYKGHTSEHPDRPMTQQLWRGHDFLLRFGARDGLAFPCELDAWLLPDEEYDRAGPETSPELARFGQGPPDLRIMGRAVFTRATVCVPRTDDPIAFAREELRREIGLTEFNDPRVEWAVRRTLDRKGYEPMPGWASTVTVRTPQTLPAVKNH